MQSERLTMSEFPSLEKRDSATVQWLRSEEFLELPLSLHIQIQRLLSNTQ